MTDVLSSPRRKTKIKLCLTTSNTISRPAEEQRRAPATDGTQTACLKELTPDVELAEAQRIAGELGKLHTRGIIQDAADPEACFYAGMLNMFGGTVVNGDKTAPAKPAKLTAEQLVKVPLGLHGKALADYLARDLDFMDSPYISSTICEKANMKNTVNRS